MRLRRLIASIGASLLFCCHPAQAEHLYAYDYQDRVVVTDNKPLDGPGGMKTSCLGIATQLGSDMATTPGGVLYDGLDKPYQQYEPSQGLFDVPFLQWTPDTVAFLKSSIDQCAKESTLGNRLLGSLTGIFMGGGSRRQTGMSMSPQMAKDVVDRIYAIASATRQQEVQIAQAQAQAATRQEAQEQALAQHVADLKSGKAKIASIDDAISVYNPKDLNSIIASPLLTADDGYYAGRVTLDIERRKGLLQAKITNYVDLSSSPPRVLYVAYVFLKIGSAQVFDPSDLRLNRSVRVFGRYVGNVQYETVSGEEKTSPVLDVMYMGQ